MQNNIPETCVSRILVTDFYGEDGSRLDLARVG